MAKKQENPAVFLQFLKEDGIEEIYLDQAPAPVKTGAPAAHSETIAPRARKEMKPTTSAPAATLPASGTPGPKEELLKVREAALACTLCGELAGTRKNVVFGSGNIRAQLMIVGEAPGADEDEQGLPFVGRAGQLLTKIIESIGLTRQQVFIANVLKCRPPQNRQPKPDEITNCQPFLLKQIELIRPKVICALGTFAAQTLLKSEKTISALRGKFHDYHGCKILCTFHPAYLLRNPDAKKDVWEDMKRIKKELAEFQE